MLNAGRETEAPPIKEPVMKRIVRIGRGVKERRPGQRTSAELTSLVRITVGNYPERYSSWQILPE
jgi:hypothetical protein